MKIEEKYGFNRSTVKTFVIDKIRGFIIELALSVGLISLLWALHCAMGDWLVILFAVTFGWKALYPVYVFVVMEILFYGLGLWNVFYLYIWTVLVVAAILLRKMEQPLGWAILSAVFGLLFGALCAVADVFIGGFSYAIAKWVSGIPFDIAHCAGNFVIALLLFAPLRKLMARLYAGMRS